MLQVGYFNKVLDCTFFRGTYHGSIIDVTFIWMATQPDLHAILCCSHDRQSLKRKHSLLYMCSDVIEKG